MTDIIKEINQPEDPTIVIEAVIVALVILGFVAFEIYSYYKVVG